MQHECFDIDVRVNCFDGAGVTLLQFDVAAWFAESLALVSLAQ